MEKRKNNRKQLSTIAFEDLTSLDSYEVLIKGGTVTNASINGFLIEVERKDLDKKLTKNLNLDSLNGLHVAIYLPQMGLDLDGFVMRTAHRGKGEFTLFIEFSQDVPDYWRDCLVELLPSDEELEDMSYAS